MTESDYWRDHTLIRDEVYAAMECFHTDRAINKCALESAQVLQKLNKVPTFWKLHTFALQTSFFIILARIFDDGPQAHSVHKLLGSTVAHPEFFSKEALSGRKCRIAGFDPEWLPEYLEGVVWEANTENLRALKKTIMPHRKRFESVYRQIRNEVFAHKLLKDYQLISALFSKTVIKDLDDTLHFLHDLISALWELGYNGREPQIGSRDYGYARRVEDINTTTQKLLGQLA